MTDPDRRKNQDDSDAKPDAKTDAKPDDRSDIQQAVEARADALDRGEGGPAFDGIGGEGGAGGVVKNQEGNDQ